MKVLAITQARYGSSRLPGKILRKIGEKTLLEIHLKRILESKNVSLLKIATTMEASADEIVQIGKKLNVESYKGSVDNVLERFYKTALPENPDYVVRLTSDCPLIDPSIIDDVINKCIREKVDYASNTLIPTFPDGLDVEVFKFSALERAYQEAVLKSDKEHVTPYIWRNSTIKEGNKFSSYNVNSEVDFSSIRITVDTNEDFLLIEKLIKELGSLKGWKEYVDFLVKNQHIKQINATINRNEGYLKSLKEDKRMGKGQGLYKKAKKIIPGGVQLLSKRPEQFLPEQWPAYYEKAKGCEVWDLDGNKYIDMSFMGIGACTLGYADDDVDAAVKKAVDKGSMCTLNTPMEVDLAELMLELHPWANMVRYARGGGDAMSIAVRIARAATKKDIILFSGYHGWHDWYLSANLSDNSALDGQLLPGLKPAGVARGMRGTSYPFFYNNIEEFLSLIKEYGNNIGGIVLEAVRNMDPEDGFFAVIEKEAKRLNVPLIVDEVSSGFRLNCGGAHLVLGLNPDIAVFAKGISNGFPMGVVIGKEKFMDAAQDSFISSTYWTEAVGPAAAIATIKKMKAENVQAHMISCGKMVQEGWKRLAEKHNLKIHISGIYPLSHFDFEDKPLTLKTLFIQEMLKQGFLTSNSYYSCYAHKKEHIDAYLNAVDTTFDFISKAQKENQIENLLNGPVCQSGFKRLS